MSFSIDENSVDRIVGNSTYVMVYGWDHCGWDEVMYTILGQNKYTLLTFELGESSSEHFIDGERIKKVCGCECKAALTNMVFENYRRNLRGQTIIPIIFCIDIDGNQYPSTPKTITSRKKKLNDKTTHTELRRAYKLCEIFGAVSRDSFRFVKLEKKNQELFSLKEVKAPWEDAKWNKFWQRRMASRNLPKAESHWRQEVKNLIQSTIAHLQTI